MRNRWISVQSFVAGLSLACLLVLSAVAQVPVLNNMDETEWSKQQMEAEARRLRSEYTPREDVQQEIAALFETRRRMAAEESRRSPQWTDTTDSMRGSADFNREVEAWRERNANERWR